MDLVKQLRAQSAYLVEFRADGPLQAGNVGSDVAPLWQRAADEIERLQRYIVALEEIAESTGTDRCPACGKMIPNIQGAFEWRGDSVFHVGC